MFILICLLLLSSCDEITETVSPGNSQIVESESPGIESSPLVSPSASIEPSQTAEPSQSIEPSPTYTPTPTPARLDTYTKSEYFTFDETTGTITGYNTNGGIYVSIPDKINGVKVERIGEYAFAQKDLYGIIIPDGVIEIQKGAFYYCFLEEAEIPKSIRIIGEKAFWVNNLVSIDLPEGLAYLGEGAFTGNQLTEITIPTSLSEINEKTFASNDISSVIIPDSINYIGDYAFWQNSLISVTLPSSLKTINTGAFRENKLTYLVIPESVENIEGYAFYENAIEDIVIPNKAVSIGEYAFSHNQIKSISIGASLESIGISAFGNNLIAELSIPDSIMLIEDSAFSRNKINNLHLGTGISEICSSCFEYNEIKDLYIPDNITKINGDAFQFNSIGTLRLSENVEIIGGNSFKDNDLTSVTIPDSVDMIMDDAFINNNIKSITVGNDAMYISDNAFDKIDGMKAICIKGSYAEYYFNKKMVEVTHVPDRTAEIMVPYNRRNIIYEDISCYVEEEQFYFAENWIREYLISRYGDSCILKTFDTKTDDDMEDAYISPDNTVYIRNYMVTYEYQARYGLAQGNKTIQMVIIKTKDDMHYLSGIEEVYVNFNDKQVLYTYLVEDYRFTYWPVPAKGVVYASSKDVEISDFFLQITDEPENTDKFRFTDTDYCLTESDFSIYLKNTSTNEKILLKGKDDILNIRYKAICAIDSERYVYAKLGNGGYEGIYIQNINDNSIVKVYYPGYDFYMVPVYADKDLIIIAHGDDHSSRVEALFRIDLSEADTGKLIKLSEDTIHMREIAISNDNRYIAYVSSTVYSEGEHTHGIEYIISDDQVYYARSVKIIDTVTGKLLKSGTIFEDANRYNDTDNRYIYVNLEFVFEDNNLYMKYKDVSFKIDIAKSSEPMDNIVLMINEEPIDVVPYQGVFHTQNGLLVKQTTNEDLNKILYSIAPISGQPKYTPPLLVKFTEQDDQFIEASANTLTYKLDEYREYEFTYHYVQKDGKKLFVIKSADYAAYKIPNSDNYILERGSMLFFLDMEKEKMDLYNAKQVSGYSYTDTVIYNGNKYSVAWALKPSFNPSGTKMLYYTERCSQDVGRLWVKDNVEGTEKPIPNTTGYSDVLQWIDDDVVYLCTPYEVVKIDVANYTRETVYSNNGEQIGDVILSYPYMFVYDLLNGARIIDLETRAVRVYDDSMFSYYSSGYAGIDNLAFLVYTVIDENEVHNRIAVVLDLVTGRDCVISVNEGYHISLLMPYNEEKAILHVQIGDDMYDMVTFFIEYSSLIFD